jgi:flagellar FliJ protein
MEKFNFRLEPVLKERERKEQQTALAQVKAHQEYLRRMEELEATMSHEEQLMETGIGNDSFDAMNKLMYLNVLRSKITKQKKRVNDQQQTLEECRNNAIQARKEKLILEKLKQNQYTSFRQQQNKIEQKENDEFATLMSMRKHTFS